MLLVCVARSMVDVDLELDLSVNSISNLPNQFQFRWETRNSRARARTPPAIDDDIALLRSRRAVSAQRANGATCTIASCNLAKSGKIRSLHIEFSKVALSPAVQSSTRKNVRQANNHSEAGASKAGEATSLATAAAACRFCCSHNCYTTPSTHSSNTRGETATDSVQLRVEGFYEG